MAIQFYINGVDYTQGNGYSVDFNSVSIASNITTTNNTADFKVKIQRAKDGTAVMARPMGLQELKILNGSVVEFAGVISKVTEDVPTAADEMVYEVEAQDYSPWFDKRLLTYTYAGKTLEYMVKEIVNNFVNQSGAGFTTNNVYDTGIVQSLKKFDHVAPSQAIQALADYVGYWFYIDYQKDVHFEPILTNTSPLPENKLLVDSDSKSYSNLQFAEDVTQIRNQVYYYGHKLPMGSQITESWTGDENTQTFTLTYEPKHSIDTGDLTVKVDGVIQTNDLDISNATPGTGSANTAYIYYRNKTLRFASAPGNVTVSCTYYPLLPTENLYNNPESFKHMKARDGMDGIYEWGTSNTNLTSNDSSLVNLAGKSTLLKYSLPHYTATFDSFFQGWKPGQYFYLTSDMRMDKEFQNKEFYILKTTKTIVNHSPGGSPIFKYSLSIADSPYNY